MYVYIGKKNRFDYESIKLFVKYSTSKQFHINDNNYTIIGIVCILNFFYNKKTNMKIKIKFYKNITYSLKFYTRHTKIITFLFFNMYNFDNYLDLIKNGQIRTKIIFTSIENIL